MYVCMYVCTLCYILHVTYKLYINNPSRHVPASRQAVRHATQTRPRSLADRSATATSYYVLLRITTYYYYYYY